MNPDSHMDPDKYQQAWQAQSSQTRVTVDANLLLERSAALPAKFPSDRSSGAIFVKSVWHW